MCQTLFFSVVIPTYRRNDALSNCLRRLAPEQQQISSLNYEVIVSDDSNSAEAERFVLDCFGWAQWVKGPGKGPAANRNHGARFAKGQWLVFTDDDCMPEPGWLQAYADAISQHPECQAFEGAILPDDWNLLQKDMAECPVNDKGGCFWSANIMVQKELFWQVGGFDEQFKIAAQEDQDLYIRLLKQARIIFVPKAVVIHPVRIVPLAERKTGIKSRAYNWIGFLKKYHTPEECAQLIRQSSSMHARMFLTYLLKGHWQRAAYHWASFRFVRANRRQLMHAVMQ